MSNDKVTNSKTSKATDLSMVFSSKIGGGGGSNDITFDNCGFNCCNVTRSHVAIMFLSAIEILSDIVQNSKLDAQEIERERDVILREMEVSLNKNIFTVNLF